MNRESGTKNKSEHAVAVLSAAELRVGQGLRDREDVSERSGTQQTRASSEQDRQCARS